ncbi:hypothetical protein [Sunxiuqinia sp. sy24]|uniref:hypothetical protein n=1 Tax=Sunxiuqinia sp. sy24 TaxID=3461495 RepID=UPI0040465E46
MIKYLAALTIKIPDYESEIIFDDFVLRKRSIEELGKYYRLESIVYDGFGGIAKTTSLKDDSMPIHWSLYDSAGLASDDT